MDIHVDIVIVLLQLLSAVLAGVPRRDWEFFFQINDKFQGMVELKGGTFRMGVNDPNSKTGEYPQHYKDVRPFFIDMFPVTNAQFRKFSQTKHKYRTRAESRGFSNVFVDFVQEENLPRSHVMDDQLPWILAVKGANWNSPNGPNSTTSGKPNHPVVHVSYRDAQAFCQWSGKRLPNEMEWEFAARGGLKDLDYPWGDKFQRGKMNIWQGAFPHDNKVVDGYEGTSPVDAFPAQNNYGLYDLLGNVWEWTTTQYYTRGVNRHEQSLRYVTKGGSYLDTRDGRANYEVRVSNRMGVKPEHTAHNVGFRCAYTIPAPPPSEDSEPTPPPPRVHKVHEMHDQRAVRAKKERKQQALREKVALRKGITLRSGKITKRMEL